MKAEFFASMGTQNSLAKAIDLLNEIILIDPRYARAYAALADCYQLQGLYQFVSLAEAYLAPRLPRCRRYPFGAGPGLPKVSAASAQNIRNSGSVGASFFAASTPRAKRSSDSPLSPRPQRAMA